ncbi:MAG: S41 family peptidase [Herpetosiphon sp.]|nr:S41 family peptidase [Herpetosiphon sp.]
MSDYPSSAPSKSPINAILGIVAALLVVGLSVGGGFLWGKSYREQNPTAVNLSASNPQPIAGQPIGTSTSQDLEAQFKTFWEVWDLVGKEFYHTKPLDQQKMVYGAIRGMLQSLGDDFTGFQEPQAAERSREDMKGSFEGIGAYVEFKDGQVLIVSPIEGSPAEKAGIRAGDVIVAADDKIMSEVTDGLDRAQALDAAIKYIRGPKGTKVVLTIQRKDVTESLKIEIIRDTIPLISVRGTMIGDIAYIQISEFKGTTADELDKKIAELKPNNPKAVIVDLRNNPGGLVTSVQNVLGRFINDGVTHYQENSDGTQKEYRVLKDGAAQNLYDIPMLVLVNNGSASASEIFSGSMQDNNRAKLLGVKTFGKGSVQSVHQLSDKSEARITIAHWLTPAKRAIHQVGITPDYVVPFSDDVTQYPVECILNAQPADGQTQCADSELFWALKVLNENATPPPPPAETPTPTPGK